METPTAALTCQVPLRWGDMDAYGHINNVSVVRLLEEARVGVFGQPAGTGAAGQTAQVEFFSALDADVQALVVEHRVRYTAALEYRNIPAVVDVWVSEVKPASITLSYLVRDPLNGEVCVKAATVLAFARAATGQLVRLSADQRDLLRTRLGAPLFG